MSEDTKLMRVHDNIWHFTVTDPQLHKKGHTIYKVTCKTFPIKSPETLTEIVCWKRYNDFKTLYKSLANLHKALHRRDAFPIFAKPKLFGRFDDTVIEERRLSAVAFLNFVATQPHLYKSLLFRQFLDDDKQGSANKPKTSSLDMSRGRPQVGETGPPPDLVPTKILTPLQIHTDVQLTGHSGERTREDIDESSTPGAGDATNRLGSDLSTLNGTWNYPQVADNISLDSSTGSETIDSGDESLLATSLPDTDLAYFDPINHDSANLPQDNLDQMNATNSWLMSGLNLCSQDGKDSGEKIRKDTLMSTDSAMSASTPSTTTLERFASDVTGTFEINDESSAFTELENFSQLRKMSVDSDSSRVTTGKGDLDLSSEWKPHSPSFISSVSSSSQRSEQFEGHASPHSNTKKTTSRSQSICSEKSDDSSKGHSNPATPKRTPKGVLRKLVTGNKPRTVTETSVSTLDLGGKEDYIYLAASQICMAQNSEANGNYEVAFAYYKSGVGMLLQGVQGDSNKGRRDAVRRKTAQYLMKAEDLFNRHLSTEKVDERRWGSKGFMSPSLDLDPSFAFIRGSVHELRNFQVLGTIDKVILVRDKSTDETFVIKSVPKSTPDIGRTASILPTSCPHMVSLHKFYETDTSVFLLLQYAVGGKLWTYIGDYLGQDRHSHAEPGQIGDLRSPGYSANIYSGTKVEQTSPIAEESSAADCKNVTNTHALKVDFMQVEVDSLDMFTGSEVPSNNDTSESNNVQSSEDKCMRLSALRKDSEVTLSNMDSDALTKDDIVEELDQVNKSDTFDRQAFSHTPLKVSNNRRFSSFSDDISFSPHTEAGKAVVSSPDPVSPMPDEDIFFQKLLKENRGNLSNFSINSCDSEDTRHGSGLMEASDRRNSILENTKEGLSSSSRQQTSRQISADEIFEIARKQSGLDSDIMSVEEPRRRTLSSDGLFEAESAKRFATSFKSDDIVENSRQLIQQVERVLSETDDRGAEEVASLTSSPQATSTDEPSIYDINRSSEDDDSRPASSSSSDANLDSPTTNLSISSIAGENCTTSVTLSPPTVLSSTTIPNSTIDVKNENVCPKQTVTVPHRLSFSRQISKEITKDLTRSASFECDLKSPTRNRVHMVSTLFSRLDSTSTEVVRLPEASIKKWMTHLITAVGRLHSLGIICRDLKPNNVLLGDGGQVYLTYFCNLGHGDQEVDWEAVEGLYAAPEIGSISGYDKPCDWWSIGALLYELLVGRSLRDCHPGGITPHTQLHIPPTVSAEARSLLEGLLTFYPRERLGAGMAGAEEIKAHPFFTGVDWHALEYSASQ